MDAQIIAVKVQAGFAMFGDDLKEIVLRDVQNIAQRLVDDLANLYSISRRFAFRQIDSNERHAFLLW
jgi:hypothetical protein